MPENNLGLLMRAARAAGDLARKFWRQSPKTWEKDGGEGPVSEADLAVNELLADLLRSARPDYGWLSEESHDNADRLSREHVFIIDPIDGTRSFLAGDKTWSHSLAIAQNGEIVTAVVLLPLHDKLYSARHGRGAHLNDVAIHASRRRELNDATLLAPRHSLDPEHWQGAAPPVTCHFRPSLAYRLAAVAQGRFDAMLSLRDTWEWDIAAGTLLAREAGATVTDRHGAAPAFNNAQPKIAGLLVAGPDLHASLIARLSRTGTP
ncbi:MAG: inositol monophosphatase [Paracoccaceae bacterium]